MVVIEAFAMRAPVVVNNAGALPELVKLSGGGFRVDNDTDLISCMENVRLNPDHREMVGNRGFQGYEKILARRPLHHSILSTYSGSRGKQDIKTNPTIGALHHS
jgi:hypothetical protein